MQDVSNTAMTVSINKYIFKKEHYTVDIIKVDFMAEQAGVVNVH